MNWSDSATIAAVQVFKGQFERSSLQVFNSCARCVLRRVCEKNGERPGPDGLFCFACTHCDRFDWVAVDQFSGYVNKHWKLKTFYKRQWCDSDSVPTLLDFIEPELD